MNIDNISVSIDDTTPCQIKVSVTVPQTEIKATFDSVMKEFKKFAQIPGFRKGKAPVGMIVKAHKEQLESEVQERITKAGYEKAFSDNSELKPAGYPTLSQDKLDLNADEYTFSMVVETEPVFELDGYKDIRVESEEVVITDEAVATALDEVRGSQKKIEKAEAGVAASKGDMLKVSYEGTVEGEVEESAQRLLKAESSWLILDNPEMLPGIAVILDGATTEESVVADVVFPADFHNDFLAGKTVSYTFDIEEIHTGVLPELNDEFAQSLQLKDLAELQEKMKERLVAQKQEEIDAQIQKEALAAVREITGDFAVSPSQLDSEFKELQSNPANEDKEEAELKNDAKERVQSFYILMALAKAEEVQVTQEEILERINAMSQYSQKDPKIMQKQLVKEGKIQGIAMDITLGKTAQRLTDIAAGKIA